MEFQRACGASIPRQVQPSLSTKRIPVSTFSIANAGRPLLDLGGVWDLTFYGNYPLGQLGHEREEIGAQIHSC